jgi:L-ascorbate metabolism protein UlaG (beta-lactamase superfamily)
VSEPPPNPARAGRRKTRRHRSLLWRWIADRRRAPAPVARGPLPAVEAGQVSITRGGHATALIRYADVAIATDPVLTRRCAGAPRLEACGLATADLEGVELVLISGLDADHLHPRSLARLPPSATCVVPRGGAAALGRARFARVLELAPGQGFGLRGVEITAAPARAGRDPALAYVIRGPGPSVYFAGLGGYGEGFAAIGREHALDLALLPIGGFVPSSFRARHLSPADALRAFADLNARILIPHRYGAFLLSYERADEPARWLAELVAERELEPYVLTLATGESRVFVGPRSRDEIGGDRGDGAELAVDLAIDIEFDDDEGDGDDVGLGVGGEEPSSAAPAPETESSPAPAPESSDDGGEGDDPELTATARADAGA